MLRKSIFAACLVMAGFTALPAQAQGPSFNCSRASRPDEVLICQHAELATLDRRMAALYDRLRNTMPPGIRRNLIADQTVWLRGRFACGYDYGCVRNAYQQRIAELQNY